MKLGKAILAAALVLGLAGCVVRGKPKTAAAIPAAPQPAPAETPPPPPPEPLSIPQTQVQLPPAQPIDPEALVLAPTETAPETPPPPPRRRAGTPTPAAPKPEAAAPMGPSTPAVEPRPPIQEMVPAAEQKRLQESARYRKKEVRDWLDSHGRRRLTRQQQTTFDQIRAFLKDSDAAENRGDMREADALAERAQILLRELQNGR